MFRRRRYLINSKLQIGLFLKWVISPIIIISGALYFLVYFVIMQHMAIPENIFYNLIPPLRKTNRILLIVGPIILILISLRVLILSHRIAGPVYRLERELARIAAGDFSIRIKFRKKDELKSIAEGINKILDEIERRLLKKDDT